MNGVQQPVRSGPSVFPAKNRRSEITVTLKTKLKWTSSDNFLATGGFFERYTYRVTALGWLKKKERKKERKKQDEQF